MYEWRIPGEGDDLMQHLKWARLDGSAIEAKYDNLLKGTDGYLQYQQDRLGYKIPDTAETRIEAINGSDVYLTLDSTQNIQTNDYNFTEMNWKLIGYEGNVILENIEQIDKIVHRGFSDEEGDEFRNQISISIGVDK